MNALDFSDEARRFPLLNEAGLRRLRWLEEHPHAPRFNHHGVDRLTAAGARRVAAYEAELNSQPRGWAAGGLPPWLAEFASFCWREVPIYRAYGAPPANFADTPACDRADLSRAPWDFVPDSQPLDGLTVFQTSGTTGHPLNILTHPETLSTYFPLLRAALAAYGVPLDPAHDEGPPLSLVVVCFQASTYTYAAISPYLQQAGLAKINLHPAEWRDPADPAKFLEACQPAIISGDPVSLAELARLPVTLRSRALVSTSMALLPGLRQQLEERFACPALDLYSMNEAGPIAVAAPDGAPDSGAHCLLQHRLYVEVLDAHGAPCPPGERGEITLTGGFNPFLPLLRYRTGDWASLNQTDAGQLLLRGLEGRAPVVFRGAQGQPINNIDVTSALKPLALPQYNLHQFADGRLRLRLPQSITPDAISPAQSALLALFGPDTQLQIELFDPATSGKQVQYSSDQLAT